MTDSALLARVEASFAQIFMPADARKREPYPGLALPSPHPIATPHSQTKTKE